MQEKHLNDLVHSAFDKSLDTPVKVREKMKAIADDNRQALSGAVQSLHLPDDQELEVIRGYMIDYKKFHPLATRREIRKAAQAKFKVKIFRKPFKTEPCNTAQS